MTYSFHPDAVVELNASVDYYQECKDGLGAEFAYEVQKTILRILEYPTAWQKLDGEIRRCLTNRFPFGKPSAKQTKIGKPFGNQLKISVACAPVNGKATDHLVKFLATQFGVKVRDIEVVFGRMNVNKQLRVTSPQKLPSVFK